MKHFKNTYLKKTVAIARQDDDNTENFTLDQLTQELPYSNRIIVHKTSPLEEKRVYLNLDMKFSFLLSHFES